MANEIVSHYLQVELIVPTDKADAFEQASADFLGANGFDRFAPRIEKDTYRFVLGLKTADPFPYRAYGRFEAPMSDTSFAANRGSDVFRDELLGTTQQVFRYVHLWQVPNLVGLDLDTIMRACVDDKKYLAIDEQVVREVQSFVRLVHQPGFPVEVLPTGEEFVRVIRRLDRADVPSYLFRFGAEIPVWESKGWHAIGQYQNVTGVLNTVTEFWQTDSSNLPALRVPTPVPWKKGATYPTGVSEVRERYQRSTYFKKFGVRFSARVPAKP